MKPKASGIFFRILLTCAILIIVGGNISTKAQKQHKRIVSNLILEGRASYGFLIPHHIEMEIFNSHFPAFEFSISKLTYGRTRWEYMYNYPYIGISYYHTNLGNSPFLGKAHAIMPFINFPLTKNKDFQLYFRTSLGIGYLTKKFHRIDNYKNIVIGSNINAAVGLLLEFHKRLGERFILTGGIGFNHFSNGSMKTPNYGINIPSVKAGLAYRLSKENPYFRQKLLPELFPFEFDGKKYLEVDASIGFGYKNMAAEFGGKHIAINAFATLLKQVSFKSRFGAGIDISYDGTDEHLLVYQENIEVKNQFQLFQLGFSGAYTLTLSRISFVANLGFYLFTKYRGDGIIYEKIALQYQINEKFFTNISLKAHAGRADYIALGFGYKLRFIYY